MALDYTAIQWNRQKRIYDLTLAFVVGAFLIVFTAITKLRFPLVTDEILLIRAFGTAAFGLLHVILCIGPLCRLQPRLLPLLYNRRHAGVTMALLAIGHAALVVITYHAGGDAHPILSVFTANPTTLSIAGVPFQAFGAIALVILLMLAATSHDFWLANLGGPVWKSLHMLVYVAYGFLLLHVAFGILQAELSPLYTLSVAGGLATVLGLHLTAALKEAPLDRAVVGRANGPISLAGFVDVCAVEDIPENRARIVRVSGERIAIFKYERKLSCRLERVSAPERSLGRGQDH
ncbi:MAG: ferric reductase-like transmembrane domain-containing protein [Verrucomicrobiota bacterium]